jgi:hypothetical protein
MIEAFRNGQPPIIDQFRSRCFPDPERPGLKVRLLVMAPYAGIIRIRFSGYDLRHPAKRPWAAAPRSTTPISVCVKIYRLKPVYVPYPEAALLSTGRRARRAACRAVFLHHFFEIFAFLCIY